MPGSSLPDKPVFAMDSGVDARFPGNRLGPLYPSQGDADTRDRVRPTSARASLVRNPPLKKLLIALVSLAAILGLLAAVFAFPLLMKDTEYAPGYSESAFREIRIGDSRAEVVSALGPPLKTATAEPWESWLYCDATHPGYYENGGVGGTFTEFTFDQDGKVTTVFGQQEARSTGILSSTTTAILGKGYLPLAPGDDKALVGVDRARIEKLHGKPRFIQKNEATEFLLYTRSPSSTHYEVRKVGLDATGRVVAKKSYTWWD